MSFAALVICGGATAARARVASTPVLATLNADSETVTPGVASISTIPYGNTLSFTVTADDPSTYSLNVALSPTETLEPDGVGGIVVASPLPQEAATPDDGSAAVSTPSGTDPDTPDGTVAADVSPAEANDTPDDGTDPTNYPFADATAPAQDGMTVVDDAVSQVDGVDVAAAIAPASATDASGVAVPSVLVTSGAAVLLKLAPTSTTTYPISVTLQTGFNVDYTPASAENSSLLTGASCSSQGAQIVVSFSNSSWSKLVKALAANPTPCATYWISVRGDNNGQSPRPNSAALISAYSSKRTVRAVGATFEPVAELYYKGVQNYATIGATFAEAAAQDGYAAWSIDEAPRSLVDQGDASWTNLIDLVTDLSSGGHLPGIVFSSYWKQDDGLSKLRGYKSDLENVLPESSGKTNFDWQTLGSGVRFWGEESYTLCSLVCVDSAKIGTLAKRTNEYMQHLTNLAFADDVPVSIEPELSPAQTFLRNRYFPLTNAWWATDSNQNSAYGTLDLSTSQMERLVGLQIYSTRSWQQDTQHHPYDSVPVIGVRWTGEPRPVTTRHPDPATEQRNFDKRVARAIAGAYAPSGTPTDACDPKQGIETALCMPQAGGQFTKTWTIFEKWKARTTQGVSCNFTGGTPTAGGPDNDDFANAQVLSGDNGSAQGTLVAAGAQVGEPGSPTRSVWYCWTATSAAINNGCWAPNTASFQIWTMYNGELYSDTAPELNVFAGSDFDSLQEIASSDSGNGTLLFPATAGVTYALQVTDPGDLPDPALFQISWPIYCL